ncbi:MAG: hypothetical protein BLM47_09385 [Candidatus Reconcilbacillus cellulovorans]|uniref:Peptidase C39-like domain-containing protein n=1 Tax=Candidatus Reconcilbacillus cellulovorans TaxID=1906605 RepID=A0A2A6DZT6_9BACL|nr:MAG: hypothetical protein BLM47_09385 [Candidatus Reconcilbacillus cellulovorans]
MTSRKIMLTVLLSFLFIPSSLFAAGTGDDPNPTSDIPTEAQIAAAKAKEEMIRQYMQNKDSKKQITPMSLGEVRTLNVTPFKQETPYWCGPATVKQVLHFLNGTSQPQSYYASKLGTTTDGTDFSKVDDVLNSHQSVHTYTYRSFSSNEYSTWVTAMILTIDWGVPAVLDLRISRDLLPNYTSTVEGHILNTSGYDTSSYPNQTSYRLRVTAPYDQGNRGATFGNKWYEMEKVWKANQAHFRKAIIW